MKTNTFFAWTSLFLLSIGFILTSCGDTKTADTNSTDCCASNKDSLKIVMNIPIKIKPEYVSAYKIAFDKCRAETLKEPTCEAYDLFQSYTDSTDFHLYEIWTNKPGHQVHMETAHVKKYFEEIKGMNDEAKTKMVVVTVCPKIN